MEEQQIEVGLGRRSGLSARNAQQFRVTSIALAAPCANPISAPSSPAPATWRLTMESSSGRNHIPASGLRVNIPGPSQKPQINERTHDRWLFTQETGTCQEEPGTGSGIPSTSANP
ncbi:hypothetical protein [Thermogemmatispora sp.]|uniref:hypothetical protein n=1 Tax=Thermogemmatispora sp. TaxID=1968838 RepID=UPI001D778893|nr:hypothetical protein [Thermogemmatispora sp.]MBX5449366.1 hypothetical protein [Thermogemmatispora sp.]